jgi:hypothetical protein
MLRRWIPWQRIISRVARGKGFLDPVQFVAQLSRFAQPSEVRAPIELLRLSSVLQARGILNSQALQHNLDWVWPYWINRQYDPRSPSFVPRAFSVTHINLTHRNWTAVGLPNCGEYPLVDPRGLVTPLYDGWSLDHWLIRDDGHHLFPSRIAEATQTLETGHGFQVRTATQAEGSRLTVTAELLPGDGGPWCTVIAEAESRTPGWLALAIRPANAEGVSFVHHIERLNRPPGWRVERHGAVYFDQSPDRWAFSEYHQGDVWMHLADGGTHDGAVHCPIGMATAAALYRLEPGRTGRTEAIIPMQRDAPPPSPPIRLESARDRAAALWEDVLRGACQLRAPDPVVERLYQGALHSVALLAPNQEVYPGPYTYRHFWFRDATFILHAMLCVGLHRPAARILAGFPARQRRTGYFCSQQGEWDSNGQVLWIAHRLVELTGQPLPKPWGPAVRRAVAWIADKRAGQTPETDHAGLFPAGFSAEHFGPNDLYYWDDFWGVAGLRAAAGLIRAEAPDRAAAWEHDADEFLRCIEQSLARVGARMGTCAMPASPHRRMDEGAIGCLVASYPLRLWPADDPRIDATVDYLLAHCMLRDGFFHEISHGGVNPYLTLHLAQCLLRRGDPRFRALFDEVTRLASPTGQWPEAIHPHTHGGCMGDGQHMWASAEWLMMLRNSFVREEGPSLVLCDGIPPAWIHAGTPIHFGPAPTPYGPVSLEILPGPSGPVARWNGRWRGDPPPIRVRIDAHTVVDAAPDQTEQRVGDAPP